MPSEPAEITLFLAGDVMTGRGIDQVLPHPGNPELHQSNGFRADDYVRRAEALNGPIPKPLDYSEIWGDALAEWENRGADLRIVNLETSITTSDEHWIDKFIHYRMHPGNAPCLTAAGFDCCVLANNHVLDWGYGGLKETLETLERVGMQSVGAGRDGPSAAEPAVLDLEGKGRVLVFAWAHASSHTHRPWYATPDRPGVNPLGDYTPETIAAIRSQVEGVKRENDLVVASIHWGPNWGYGVGPRRRWFARRLIDEAGVHLVHGHSSHHPLGVELHRGRLILSGCGDFMNDYEGTTAQRRYRPDLVVMYFARLQVPGGRLLDLDLVPMQLRGLRLRRASGADARWLCDTLNRGGIPASRRAWLSRLARRRRTRFNGCWEIQPDDTVRIVPR